MTVQFTNILGGMLGNKTTVRLPDSYHSFYPSHPFSPFLLLIPHSL